MRAVDRRGDTASPSAPPNLRVGSATQNQIMVRWDPATDNVGIVNYRIYRNGTMIGQGPGSSGGLTDQWTDNGRTCGTTYQYAVEAQDAAGNTGAKANLTAASAVCDPTSPPPTSPPPTSPPPTSPPPTSASPDVASPDVASPDRPSW